MTSHSRKAAMGTAPAKRANDVPSAALEKPTITGWEKEKPYTLKRFYKWELEQELHSRKAAERTTDGILPIDDIESHPRKAAEATKMPPATIGKRYNANASAALEKYPIQIDVDFTGKWKKGQIIDIIIYEEYRAAMKELDEVFLAACMRMDNEKPRSSFAKAYATYVQMRERIFGKVEP